MQEDGIEGQWVSDIETVDENPIEFVGHPTE